MQLKTYDDMVVKCRRYTAQPWQVVHAALYLTQHGRFPSCPKSISPETLKYLIKAEHTAPLEFVDFTFTIEGVSRAFLAQITRHRMASYMSASQHYTNYSDMPMVLDTGALESTKQTCKGLALTYSSLVREAGVPIEEARMVLPNASTVNLIFKINLRSLLNFFRIRSCNRNVKEMQIFCEKLRFAIRDIYTIDERRVFNPLMPYLWPPCVTDGACNQGKMRCNNPPKPWGI